MRHQDGTLAGGGGIQIYYQRWRPEGDPRATVVLAHGVGEHSGRYEHVARFLTDGGYEVWAPDHRGHGRSGGQRVYVERFATYVADLETLRLAAAHDGPDKQFLVGHSMGGAIALAHAIERPGSWAGLVLSNPAVDPSGGVPGPVRALGRLVAKVAPRVGVVALDASLISRDPAVVAAYRTDPLVHTGKLTAGLGAALLDRAARFASEVGRLDLPVLVLVGGDDRLVNPAGIRRLFPMIGAVDKSIIDYPGLYHEVFNEPEQAKVLADLTAWLDRH